MHSFDDYGFLSDVPIAGRETTVAPPDVADWPDGKRPNWTGHAWVYMDYPVPASQQQIKETVRAIDAHAKALRDYVVSNISPAEMASWPIKRAEAAAYLASGNATDAPMLGMEAYVRGVDLGTLAQKVLAKATLLSQLEAAIAGAAGRHTDAVSAITRQDDLMAYDWTVGWPGS